MNLSRNRSNSSFNFSGMGINDLNSIVEKLLDRIDVYC